MRRVGRIMRLRVISTAGMILASLVVVVPAGRALGQAAITNVTQPIPVINTGGHSAPVRALVFAPPDGAQLLSAGFDKVIQVWNLRDEPPGLAKTIRPRIWRGFAGWIYALALAPRPETDGQRILAVAGSGVTERSR